MDIEDQMKISALLGIPIADLMDKAEYLIDKVDKIVCEETHGSRQALILMAAVYLHYVHLATPGDCDIIEEAQRGIWIASELLAQSLIQETTL